MLAAIPLFGSRVSPRCLFSSDMLVVEVKEGKIVSRKNHSIHGLSEDGLLDELVELGIDALICGGAAQDFLDDAEACGVKIINNVAGELEVVLEALKEDRLVPGFGLSRNKDLKPACIISTPTQRIHCIQCTDRSCLEGKPCVQEPFKDIITPTKEELHIAEVAADVSSEDENKLCRVAEVVHFALGMGYKRIGVAFCVELFQETEILCRVLSRFFEVVPVCCKVAVEKDGPMAEGKSSQHPLCNVFAQSELLNRYETDLNLMVGLCIGCDILFAEHSNAPTTTLFVKDKSLANNPVGALYSKYYLEDLVEQSEADFAKGAS